MTTVQELLTRLENLESSLNVHGLSLKQPAECKHGVQDNACIACYMEQAEQEPVGWWDGKEDAFFEHELCGLKAPAEFHIPLYAAPVRTKDLTDDEIESIVDSVGAHEVGCWQHVFARAVIAADREKNK